MKIPPILAVAATFSFLTLSAASQPTSSPAGVKEPYSLGFAEFMIFTQIRHAKLWIAGDARNWDLADYQIDELKEGLEDAAKHYPKYKDIPVGQMIEATMKEPIEGVESAIKARDRSKFIVAFDKLSAACNTCHQSAKRPFIVIQRPTVAPYSNQSFAPKR